VGASFISQPQLTSSIVGLGTLGYISSLSTFTRFRRQDGSHHVVYFLFTVNRHEKSPFLKNTCHDYLLS
jgi:hypothetical protein